ncbi:MAG: hypothetical protein M1833_000123 [Piccolia ochrophora]|nr:MAG: hypothetical protein M1833_000123 [Piccolia ochrophora]
MAQFDAQKAYAAKQETFFDDGREIALLHFVYSHPSLASIRGSPAGVLDAIDEYGKKQFLMNVGSDKGNIVTDLIAEVKPRVMVELGGYVGYSAIKFGEAFKKAGGERYYSLEFNAEFAAIVSSLVDLAGLSEVVKVVVGGSAESLHRLHAEGVLSRIDLLFLDHLKQAYKPDLKLCEQLGLVGPGTVLAADNVIDPGNPPYLEYVRSTVEQKRKRFEGGDEDEPAENWVTKNTLPAYKKSGRLPGEASKNIEGNPNLIYESKLIESFEPTGGKASFKEVEFPISMIANHRNRMASR